MPSDSTTSDPRDPASDAETVQLVVSDPGNRRVITGMLADRFEVDTGSTLADADLYLIEDQLLPRYREALRSRVEQSHPTFCPVVVIRRDTTDSSIDPVDEGDGPLLVDEFVDAPVDRAMLHRRLRSLLIRRQQSMELMQQVSTLEARERDLRRFERAVENTGNAIALLDTDGEIRYVNPAFESATGHAEADALGESLELLQPGETSFDDAFWRTVYGRGLWEGEIVAERRDGTNYVADATITTITTDDADMEGFVVVLRDITERIQRERMLREREEELDLLRQVLTRYLRHNLRNDLNVILGYAECLEESSSAEVVAYAETIVRKTNRLLETSDTARRYSTLIERGSGPSECDISAVVVDAVSEVRESYPSVAFDVDVPESCRAVAGDGIRDVMVGLVENAAEHNDSPEPWVEVRLRPGERPRLIIEDNGPGIPKHDLEAFDAGHESPLSHSTGIGVWLSKWVIEGAGGTLSFDTDADGTRAIVELPPPDADPDSLTVTDLKAREQRLRTIIDRMTDAVIEVDGSWRVTFIDSRAQDILDVDADAVLDRDFWEVFPRVRDGEFEAVYREVMESRVPEEIEAYYGPLDGWLAVYVYPDFDGGLSFYFRDITERKTRERMLEHRQHVLREVYEIIADRDRSFTDQVESLLALGREELAVEFGTLSRIEGDDYIPEIVDADDEDLIRPGEAMPLSATNCEVAAAKEQTLVFGDIERDAPGLADRAGYTDWGFSCYLGAPVFLDGEVYGTFCFYDTEPRAGQFSEWEVTLVDLLSRWVSYGLQVARDTERLNRENERLDRFVSVISHDLRNPMNVLAGSIELAAETGDFEQLEQAERAIDRMNALVDDLLKLARSDKIDPELEVTDLATVVDRSWEVVPTDGARLTVTSDRRLRADPTMLEQLVENLLRNAVVHGGEGVSIAVIDIEGGFAIADDGPGIPAEDREQVFEMGYSTDTAGTGFGLSIVKEVADAHGWDLVLTESAEGGVCYEITGVDVIEG